MLFKYDIALSFAGEQRPLAQRFARRLDASGYSVFYDEYRQAELWGSDLSIALSDVYAKESRHCLIFLSSEYLAKPWTTHERRSAISAFIASRSNHVLCLKLEDIDLPGFPSVMGYLTLARVGKDDTYGLLLKKLGAPRHTHQVSSLSEEDTQIARKIIGACLRRAIYTRMDAEIGLDAMVASMRRSLGTLQQLAPSIGDQSLQFACNKIISALDDIERICVRSHASDSYNLSRSNREKIDKKKQTIIALLLNIRRAAMISMQLPFALSTEHFHGSDADEKPLVEAEA